MHRVIFVARSYDGAQIGAKRYEGYLKVARSAILHMPELPERKIVQVPWDEDYCSFSDMTDTSQKPAARGGGRGHGLHRPWVGNNRGRGRGSKWQPPSRRPMRGGRPMLHMDELEHLTENELKDHLGEESVKNWVQIVEEAVPDQKFDEYGFPLQGEALLIVGSQQYPGNLVPFMFWNL